MYQDGLGKGKEGQTRQTATEMRILQIIGQGIDVSRHDRWVLGIRGKVYRIDLERVEYIAH
jgi:hypothetical protein